jgi:imidazolonepropionase-like amidohydrolase
MTQKMTGPGLGWLLFVCLIGPFLAGQREPRTAALLDPRTETTDDPRRIPVQPGPRGPEGVTVLRDGRIFDGTGSPVREGSIVIRRNKIEKILPAGASDWPKDARLIDVKGKTVMPGLIDAHTHIDYAEPETSALLEISEADAMLRAVERARFYLECGITSVRDVGSLGNVPFRLKDWVSQNRVPAPRIFPAGAFITSTGGHGAEGYAPEVLVPQSTRLAEGPDQWRQAVRSSSTAVRSH